MSKFILEIKTENAAFEESPELVLVDILRQIAHDINCGNTSLDYGVVNSIFDGNGNKVGKYYTSKAE